MVIKLLNHLICTKHTDGSHIRHFSVGNSSMPFCVVMILGISYICAHVPMSLRARTSVPDDWLVIKVSESDWDLWWWGILGTSIFGLWSHCDSCSFTRPVIYCGWWSWSPAAELRVFLCLSTSVFTPSVILIGVVVICRVLYKFCSLCAFVRRSQKTTDVVVLQLWSWQRATQRNPKRCL